MELPPRHPTPLGGADPSLDALVAELDGSPPPAFAEVWSALGRHGVLERFAGTSSLTDACATLEELAHRTGGLGLFLSIVAGCGLALPILEAAGPAGIAKTLRAGAIAGDRVLAVAITEPGAGSDAMALASTLSRRDGTMRLDGRKWNITNAPVADHVIVFCSNATTDQRFLTAVAVPRDAPGVETPPAQHLIGARGSPTGELVFEDVAIDPGWVLGREEDGRRLLELAFLRERLLAPWPLIGRMERVLQEAIDFAQEREQFGAPIATYQHVQEKIVTSFEALQTTRLLARAALDAFTAGAPSDALASLAKYHAAESAAGVFKAMIEVHGSRGLQASAGLGDDLADALCASVAGGTREIHKRVVFGQLLLDRARARRSGRSSLFRLAAAGRRR